MAEETILLRCHNMRPGEEVQPRPRTKDRRHGHHLKALTQGIVDLYNTCSDEFKYSAATNPKRTLTWPAEGVHNGGYDNAEHNYICHVGEHITNQQSGKKYEIIENLGQGSFGQVVKVQIEGQLPLALKISKNKPAYFNQGCIEANILKRLNTDLDSEDKQHIVRMLDCFVFRKHLCIAFELLSMNLFEFLKWNNYRGVALPTIRTVTHQLLKALNCLRTAALIHCDLKPENVMIYQLDPIRVKLIDFGSACTEYHTLHSYIQSRFYRSPEVLLGLPYTSAIDMWSLGCICAELFLGLPMFPGQSEYDQVCCIVKVLGNPPLQMLNVGSKTKRYFKRVEEALDSKAPGASAEKEGKPCPGDAGTSEEAAGTLSSTQAPSQDEVSEDHSSSAAAGTREGSPDLQSTDVKEEVLAKSIRSQQLRGCRRKQRTSWRLKSCEEYERDEHKKALTSKRSWNFKSLKEMVKHIPEEKGKLVFLQFLGGLFQTNPKDRWTAKQALVHFFVNLDASYDENFQPPPDDVGPAVAWAQQSARDEADAAARLRATVAAGYCNAGQPPHFAPSSTTGTPASSPHGSASSTVMSGAMFTGASAPSCTANSTHGSSPWHLASPMGDLSTASDCVHSSQPSGSDCSRSLSDTSGSHRGRVYSDSDSTSAMGSHGSGMEEHAYRSGKREPNMWKNLQSVTRGDLSSRLTFESALSPKGAAAGVVGSFREAVGMGESGPVVPVGPRDVFGAAMEDTYPSDVGRAKAGATRTRGRRRRAVPP